MVLGEFIVSRITLCRRGSSRITGVEVPGDEFLSASVSDLTHKVVVVAVRRSHEGGLDANNALESLVDKSHLRVDLIVREFAKVLVSPSVRSNHVSLAVGKFNPRDIFRRIDTII